MKSMSFSYTVSTSKTIDNAINGLTQNLKVIGFGVLGSLNFKKILEEKGLEFKENYQLLEVCNPKLAKQVLDSNPELGLLLPCTIAVYQKKGRNFISLARPSALLGLVSENNMQFLGNEIEKNLIDVIEKSK